jgi:hypothetical protein
MFPLGWYFDVLVDVFSDVTIRSIVIFMARNKSMKLI